jgi:hypothetical protein
MESNDQVKLQILHFNDTYEIEKTPLFTASLLSTKRKFLEKEIPNIVKNNKIFKKSVDLHFEQTKLTGLNHDKE